MFLGGGLGSVARFALGTLLLERFGVAFPFGTLAVNVIGSALLAALTELSLSGVALSVDLRIALSVGFLGGFTTYSAFNQETFAYLQDGAWAIGAGYAAVTVLGCFVASIAGYFAARWLVGG